MHPSTHLDVAARPRDSGFMARVLDVAIIVGGALMSARDLSASSHAGYDSAVVAFVLVFAIALFPALGMYRVVRRQLWWRCVCVPLVSWGVALAASVALVSALHPVYRPALDWLGQWSLLAAPALVACRLAECGLSLRRLEQAAHTRAVAIVGSGEHCRQLMRKVEAAPDSIYRVSTLFDTGPDGDAAPGSLPSFRDPEGFAAYVRRYGIDELWLALPLSQERTILQFIELFRHDLVNIRFIPDVRELALFDGEMVDLDGTSAINLVGSPLSSGALVKKEVFDRVFAVLVVAALWPLLLAIAVAVKLSSPGPVLFTQRRKGAHGRIFRIYKFRSMRQHAEAEGVVRQATRDDSRVTRVGAFLRRTSLDELPQFFNVLRGEMSVVGPRPHAIEHDALYQDIVDGYIHRYRIKPGITGWAQINGFRGETDCIEKMRGRVEHDLYYLSNWSFGLDMRIVLATAVKGLTHQNAY